MRRFSIQILIRVVLIITVSVFLGLILGDSNLLINQLIFGLVLIGLIIEFLTYIKKVNQRLIRLFESLRHSDFTVSFTDDYLGKSFEHLNKQFAQVIKHFKAVKIEKEQQFQLMSLLIESIPTGVIAVRQNEQIILFNSSAGQILDVSRPNNWSLFKRLAGEFAVQIDEMGAAGSQLLELKQGDDIKLLTITVSTSFDTNGEFRLITIKNIQNEIEQRELEAWHRLIRVLTHEMMNSLTPISSLSETMLVMLSKTLEGNKEIDKDSLNDLHYSLEMINNRSSRMTNFLEEYRKITRVPVPVFEEIELDNLLREITQLAKKELEEDGIELVIKSTNASINLDQGQIELVFLNLIKNSRQALAETRNPQIIIDTKIKGDNLVISIEDNGPGIESKVQSQIFIPFFTTKEAGSGIGLSLSRQILKLHRAYIHLERSTSEGAVFELTFPYKKESAKKS